MSKLASIGVNVLAKVKEEKGKLILKLSPAAKDVPFYKRESEVTSLESLAKSLEKDLNSAASEYDRAVINILKKYHFKEVVDAD